MKHLIRESNMENKDIDLIGKTLEEVAKIEGIKYRVMFKDGEVRVGTCDFKPERYNLSVRDGVVVGFTKG